MSGRARVAIVGAGPIGLEAAIAARELDLDPVVYERGAPGEHIRRWGFVELFSPWRWNATELGLRVLDAARLPRPDPERCPTGRELVDSYLDPLAASLGAALRTRVEVAGIGRVGLIKREEIATARRAEARFRLLLRDRVSGREWHDEADWVIDASGVYGQPLGLGREGLAVPGEASAADRLARVIPDALGAERDAFAGKRTLLAGSGYSAATLLDALAKLRDIAARTEVVWLRRSGGSALAPIADDPLPERARLTALANRIARAPIPGFRVIENGAVDEIAEAGARVRVVIRSPSGSETIDVDRIASLVGYRPDTSMTRELQVHHCYATEGTMKLAAALIGSAGCGAGGDCLTVRRPGAAALANPEPGFFVIGHKSYGRRSDFLLRHGHDQVRDVFELLIASR